MQTRTITVDYARPRGYDIGYRAENNFTLLALPIPAELEGADSYRVYFESTVGEYLQTELLTPADGYVTVKITSDVVPEPGNMAAQLVAFADGEIVGYAPMITGSAKVSIPDGTERLSHSLAAEIALNTAARHSHANKSVLDKFAESDGKPTYNGEALGGGGGAGDFVIKMTVKSNGDESYTVTSCDATVEQIDAAFNADKNIVLTVAQNDEINKYFLSLTYAMPEFGYLFESFYDTYFLIANIDKRNGTTFAMTQTPADAIDYSNAALPNISTVGGALDALVPNSHTHANKNTLDRLSDANGKLQYNGSDVGLKPAYYIDLAGTYPNYTCPVAMDDITAAYNSGYNLVCRCQMGVYTATLPLFVPMPSANTWIFSGSGALKSMGFPAQSFTIAITANGVSAQNERLMPFPIPYKLTITAGNIRYQYDGSHSVGFAVQPATQLITSTGGGNITLADNTEYRLTDVTTLTLNYPTGNFECWMRLTFAVSGNVTVTLPTTTQYIGTTPAFANGETWELSIKDGVVIAQKVGEGA